MTSLIGTSTPPSEILKCSAISRAVIVFYFPLCKKAVNCAIVGKGIQIPRFSSSMNLILYL